jgi:hypothetical protein
MSQVRDLIAQLPDWVSVTPDQWPKEAPRINVEVRQVGRQMAAFDLGSIRSGIQEFAPPGSLNVEDAGRLLLLNRIVFEVPEWADSVGFFGGFVGPQTKGGQAQIGWPFDQSGEIVHPFRGYMGDEFQALSEFDRFAQQYPRRRWD